MPASRPMSIGDSLVNLKSSMTEIEMQKDEISKEQFMANYHQQKESIKIQKRDMELRVEQFAQDLNLRQKEHLCQHDLDQAKLSAKDRALDLKELEISNADKHCTVELELCQMELLNEQKRLDLELAKLNKSSQPGSQV